MRTAASLYFLHLPVLCEAKSSTVQVLLNAVCLDFHHGERAVLDHGDSRGSQQHCAVRTPVLFRKTESRNCVYV